MRHGRLQLLHSFLHRCLLLHNQWQLLGRHLSRAQALLAPNFPESTPRRRRRPNRGHCRP